VKPRALAALLAVVIALVVALPATGTVVAIWQARQSVSTSDRRWCSTLALLTARPVPRPADPKANPSREDAWRFYVNLRTLEHHFGCPVAGRG
jgi:hypothetical protein